MFFSPQRLIPPLRAAFVSRGAGLFCLILCATAPASEAPLLRIAFEENAVVVSGRVRTEAEVATLAEALKGARPDLVPDLAALSVDPSVPLTDLGEMPSLLAELGLSTHEGRLELWEDRLVIGGLTDSLVTQSALRIRAEPFLKGRSLHNRLCIVGTDDLPKIAVSLSGAKVDPQMAAPAATPVIPPTGGFESAGLSFSKLLAVIRLPGQIDRLAGRTAAAPAPPAGLRAEPLGPAERSAPAAPTATMPATPLTATPVQTFETLTPVLFSRNSFLLQANQQATIEGLVKHLRSPARRGAPVRIEAVKASGGSTAFNEYLCERRAAEVARFLSEGGVDPALLRTKSVESSSPVDSGEVRLFVEILPPEPEPQPDPTSDTDDGAPAKPPASSPPASTAP
jgi:outer membrane protein OmpA-like peptidoglycan-associated protein